MKLPLLVHFEPMDEEAFGHCIDAMKVSSSLPTAEALGVQLGRSTLGGEYLLARLENFGLLERNAAGERKLTGREYAVTVAPLRRKD